MFGDVLLPLYRRVARPLVVPYYCLQLRFTKLENRSAKTARITDRTRSMFRAILAENGIADTDNAASLESSVPQLNFGGS